MARHEKTRRDDPLPRENLAAAIERIRRALRLSRETADLAVLFEAAERLEGEAGK